VVSSIASLANCQRSIIAKRSGSTKQYEDHLEVAREMSTRSRSTPTPRASISVARVLPAPDNPAKRAWSALDVKSWLANDRTA
jgi:hypothetical protein